MFDNLEALLALDQYGSISRAAAHLGLTQSAVSKRIRNLGHEIDQELIEPDGRGVVLTPFGHQLVERVRPSILDLRGGPLRAALRKPRRAACRYERGAAFILGRKSAEKS